MAVQQVTIEEFKDKFIKTGIENGLPDNIVNKLENIYDYYYHKYVNSLPYKANEILQQYITNSVISIKVSLINTLKDNSSDNDSWIAPMSEVIENYRVA